jgi:hypothetical protein
MILFPLLHVPGVNPRRFLKLFAQERTAQRMRDVVSDPVHPLFDGLSLREIIGVEIYRLVLGREVTDDGVAFTHYMCAVDDDGCLPGDVELQEFRCAGSFETASEVFTNERNADPVGDPEHLAHVERIGATGDS